MEIVDGACHRGSPRTLRPAPRYGDALGALFATVVLTAVHPSAGMAADWPMFGRDTSNTANQSSETAITTSSVSSLGTKWIFPTQ